MKTKTEIRNWLLENAVDEDGDLQLSDLDFSEFDGNVLINYMTVKESLFQSFQNVGGNLYQRRQNVKGNLSNHSSTYGGLLYEEPSTKILKEITSEELAELGYILKGEN